MASTAQVMLVDDDADCRALARAVIESGLEHVDAHITECGTAGEAVRSCTEHVPDVVVLDIHLPDTTGLAVLRHLSHVPDPPDVVAWSADDIALQHALRRGAKLAVHKASSISELIRAIDRCLVARGHHATA